MSTTRIALVIAFSILFFVNEGFAQNPTSTSQPVVPSVTASVSAIDTIRFTAPGQVLQIRVEIYSANGDLVSDSGLRAGSIVDWKVADATQPMTDGQYLSVITVRDLNGQFKQRLGGVTVQSGQVSLRNQPATELTSVQAQALKTRRQSQKIDSGDNVDAVTILRDGKERAVILTAHDGQNGQISTTSGPLTFRTGDFFSNRAKEQMRIMPDGRVGIGTDNPQATLDVAGTISARGGIRFDDGTVLTSARGAGAGITNLSVNGGAPGASTSPNLSGTGTTNKVTKWIDNAGAMGDSSILETNGLTVFGRSTPLLADAADYHLVEMAAPGTKTPLVLVGGSASMEFWKNTDDGGSPTAAMAFGMATPGTPASNDMVFSTYGPNIGGWAERFRVTQAGNVGIGVGAPAQRLEVLGNIKVSGAGNGIMFSDGSKLTSANGAGGSMTGTAIVTAINDAGTAGLIGDARVSTNLARLNGANAWSGSNVFGAGLSANGALVSNVGNPVNAGDATNKAYVDLGFIKFVPGAEQLSVGDANGTAPMINLRGGSTCCSGPGGHTPAWFKVFQNGSFVATGNLGIGVSPMQGKGYRTSWDSYKGAFRSGYADTEWDDSHVGFFSWAGGSNSTAGGLYALAFGDTNQAESTSSIVFGSGNQVKGAAGFSAGAGNRVCDTYGVAFGNKAQSGGPLINGKCDPDSFNIRGLAAVAMGYNVTADQDHTMALGKFASNNGFTGTFVWSDGSPTATAETFRNTANNEFAARATGGFRFRTNLSGTTGCNLPAGSGVFNCTSSRATKENFMLVNGNEVLSKLRGIPVSSWNYISEGRATRHIGPMAEDFYQAFNLGTGSASIGVQDLTGVSLAAIKALDQRTNELQQKKIEVEQLQAQVNELRAMNSAIEQRLAALEHKAGKIASRHHR